MFDFSKSVTGNTLCHEDQRRVLAAYVHRNTREHRPMWARKYWNGKPYPVQFASDREWLERTLFVVRNNGRIDLRFRECHSRPTWPDNPALRTDGNEVGETKEAM